MILNIEMKDQDENSLMAMMINDTMLCKTYCTCARRVPCPLGVSKTSPCQAFLKPTISRRPSSTNGGVKSLCKK